MKLNRILKYAAVSALAFSTGLTTVSCTDDFETLNTDQYEVDPNTLPFSAQFKNRCLMYMLRNRTCSSTALV